MRSMKMMWPVAAVGLVVVACSASPNPSTCGQEGDSCSGGSDCCSNTCNSGTCGCANTGGDCENDVDCCNDSDSCSNDQSGNGLGKCVSS